MIAFYEGKALAGFRILWEDLKYWASGKQLKGDAFFEENLQKILSCLVAMADAGIYLQGLIWAVFPKINWLI
jgi:hypothetical protein